MPLKLSLNQLRENANYLAENNPGRSKQVTLVGDLEKAFLMVAVDERHRDFLRFLC